MRDSAAFLLNLFRMMVRIRTFEESLVESILSGEIHTPCHLCSGQEAVAAGLCATLQKTDYIFGHHRSHGHFLAKGGSMKALAAEVYCREAGCSRGRGGSMHLVDTDSGMLGSAPIVAGTIPLAVGAALASSIRKDTRVTVSFFGDGATSEGGLYECLNFASLKKLPIIFACENNLYATHLPIREYRVDLEIAKIAEPWGIPTHCVDGNDVLQVYDAGMQAVQACRSGCGPVFMEFRTYRLRGHVGPDDNIQGFHTDIRPAEEIALWRKKDPIMNLERYLTQERLVEGHILEAIRKEAAQEVLKARAFARRSPYPNHKEMTRYVFA